MHRLQLEQCCAWQGLSASTQDPCEHCCTVTWLHALPQSGEPLTSGATLCQSCSITLKAGFSPESRIASFVRHSEQSNKLLQTCDGSVWSCSHRSALHGLFQEALPALIWLQLWAGSLPRKARQSCWSTECRGMLRKRLKWLDELVDELSFLIEHHPLHKRVP